MDNPCSTPFRMDCLGFKNDHVNVYTCMSVQYVSCIIKVRCSMHFCYGCVRQCMCTCAGACMCLSASRISLRDALATTIESLKVLMPKDNRMLFVTVMC